MLARPSKMDRFRTWLTERGAIVEEPTSEWEVLRVRTDMGLHVVYRNKKGAETWPEEAKRLLYAFEKRLQMNLSPDRSERRKVRGLAKVIGGRDGFTCWFCAVDFGDVNSDAITIEHLCPKRYGGPDHVSNLVLACEPCNGDAGTLSIAEKVLMREARRPAPRPAGEE